MARWRSLHASVCACLYSEAGMVRPAKNHKLQQCTEMLKTIAQRRKKALRIPSRPLAQELRGRARSIGQPRLAGRAETLLPLTTSQSIVADYQPERRADAAAALHWRSVSLPDRLMQPVAALRTSEVPCECSVTHTHCNVDNLCNEGRRVATLSHLSSAGCGAGVHFILFTPLWTPRLYEHPKLRMEKPTVHGAGVCAQPCSFFHLHVWRCCVAARGPGRAALLL